MSNVLFLLTTKGTFFNVKSFRESNAINILLDFNPPNQLELFQKSTLVILNEGGQIDTTIFIDQNNLFSSLALLDSLK
jgi:hypothetical protein